MYGAELNLKYRLLALALVQRQTVAAVVKTALSATGAVGVVAPPGGVLVSVSIEVR